MSFTPQELHRLRLADEADGLGSIMGRPRKPRVPPKVKAKIGRPRAPEGDAKQERRRAQWRAYFNRKRASKVNSDPGSITPDDKAPT